MLRVLIRLAAILMVGGALAATIAQPAAWPCLAVALLFAIGCLCERRYRAGRGEPSSDDGFQPTSERFIDPETGRPMSVWFDPATGERRYRNEDAHFKRSVR